MTVSNTFETLPGIVGPLTKEIAAVAGRLTRDTSLETEPALPYESLFSALWSLGLSS